MNKKMIYLLSVIVTSASSYTVQAEGLGRLFTTPAQRAMLEKLRLPVIKSEQEKPKYEPITIVNHEELPPLNREPVRTEINSDEKTEEVIVRKPEIVIIEKPDLPEITVNGIVKRTGGRSTAWVNGINTHTGYIESQHIEVNPRRIGRDHVHVEIDDLIMDDVSLKVGQTLDPDQAKITDAYENIITTESR